MRRFKLWLVAMVLMGAAVVLYSARQITGTSGGLTLTHIHGLGFSTAGTRLLIPRHDGLAVCSQGEWSLAPGPQHDYMGFTVTRDAFYSSGHPAPGSPLQNPFGLMKSPDGGQTWERLGLSGEADFHLLAASYQTNAVYVVNQAPNSRMPQPGLYSTTTDGKQWQRANAAGATGQVRALAVHPTRVQVVALGTTNGLFLSHDTGEQFKPLRRGSQVLALFFAFDGEHLWISSFDGSPALSRLVWQTGQLEPLTLPSLEPQDAVSHIAQNPVNTHAWALATFKRDVYVSSDNGSTWKQIAKQGRTL